MKDKAHLTVCVERFFFFNENQANKRKKKTFLGKKSNL